MRGTTTTRRVAAFGAAVALLLPLAACSSGSGADDLGRAAPEEETSTQEPQDPITPPEEPPVTCADDPLASYDPLESLPSPDDLPSGSTMAEIRERGWLIVGVSADTLLLGSRNPFTGQIEGFDIDMLREVSRAIFGEPDRLQFRVITSGQRIEVLTSGEVDLVARAFTVNCERWSQIAFSAIYYNAGQKVLVAQGSDAQGLEDLGGQRVCAPEGTTTIERLAEYPDVVAVPAPTHSQCLALFQQGQVDAITGDDTILAGFAAQDPYAEVVGEAISEEPYGIGVPQENVDMVSFVNTVLAQMIEDGTWTEIYDRWLGEPLGPAPEAPTAVYGRTE